MSNEIYDIVKDYVIKNPDLNYTEIADVILDDNASDKSHRTLRRYASEVKADVITSQQAVTFPDDDEAFLDIFDFANSEDIDLEPDFSDELIIPDKPKILILDIETSRMIFGAWACGKQYLGPDQIIKDWIVLGLVVNNILDQSKLLKTTSYLGGWQSGYLKMKYIQNLLLQRKL
jgi:hypothetical protein